MGPVSDDDLRNWVGHDPIESDLMKRMTATEAKGVFGSLLKAARVEPVVIERQGQEVVVALSVEEYQRLKELEEKVTSSDVAKLPGSLK